MKILFSAPGWVVGLAFFAAAGLAVLLARSKKLPVSVRVLRACAAGILLALALGPEVVRTRKYEKLPGLAVLVDASVYMKGPSGVAGADKYAQAVDWCRANRSALLKFSDPAFFTFGKELKPLNLDKPGSAGRGASDLAGALTQVSRAMNPPPARVLVITDGISRAEQGAAPPKAFAPVDFMAAGVLEAARDLRAGPVKYSEFAFLHLPQRLEVPVTARGLKGRAVAVTVTEGGRRAGSFSFVPKTAYEVAAATITVRPDSLGSKHAVLTVAAAGAKTVTRELDWQVIHEKRRVLYLCGRPSYDYSLLRDFIKNDPNNELVTFVILRNPENYVPSVENELSLIQFPAQQIFADDLNLFDVVVLDNFSFNRLGLPANYAQNLAGFVKNGGALVAMGTDNIYSPSLNPAVLFDMLPAEVSPNRDSFVTWPAKCRPERHPVAELAGTDLESRLMWDQLAPLLGFTVFKGLKTGAEPVLSAVSPEGRTYPAAVTWRYGKGRVMALASASTWRWKMLAAENPVAAGAYGLFWNRVFSYLSGGLDIKPVTLSADGAALVEGEKGLFTLKVLGRDRNPLDDATAVISAEAVSAGNRKDTLVFRYVRPGVYQAELAELAQGRVAVRAAAVSNGVALGNDSAVFSVRGRGSDVSDLNVIDALAAELGGRAYLPAGLDLRDWSAAFPRPERAEEIVSRKPMSTAWYAGAVILMLLAAEWIIRRLRGIL